MAHAIAEETRKAQAPYVPYRSFRSFFEKYDVLPSHVDRSLLKYTSGGNATQILHALRALDLITADGSVTAKMETLAEAFKANDKPVIASVLKEAYPSLFELDLQRATPNLVRAKFEAMGFTGETVRKSMAFFFAAAEDAGIPYASHLKSGPGPRKASPGRIATRGTPSAGRSVRRPVPSGPRRSDESPAVLGSLPAPLLAVLGFLPGSGESWDRVRRDKFVMTFENLLDLCYPVEDAGQ